MDLTKLFKTKVYEDPDKDRRFKEYLKTQTETNAELDAPRVSTAPESLANLEAAGNTLVGIDRKRNAANIEHQWNVNDLANARTDRRLREHGGMVSNHTNAQLQVLNPVMKFHSGESDKIGSRLDQLIDHNASQSDKYMAHERSLQEAELSQARSANTMNLLTNILGTAAMFAL